jgi:hypothetical protein
MASRKPAKFASGPLFRATADALRWRAAPYSATAYCGLLWANLLVVVNQLSDFSIELICRRTGRNDFTSPVDKP